VKSKYHFLFIYLFLTNLPATTINIPADYATIQEGIDASQDGDIVLIAEGTYYENLTLNKEITLTSTADFNEIEGNDLDKIEFRLVDKIINLGLEYMKNIRNLDSAIKCKTIFSWGEDNSGCE